MFIYNQKVLTDDICELLLQAFPILNSEYIRVSEATYNYESDDKFATCDLFVILIGCVPYNIERLEAIRFNNIYHEKLLEISYMKHIF